MRKATLTAKNDSKYINCTLECIKLCTCTKLSLKLKRENVWAFSGLHGPNNKNVFSICLVS